MLKQKVLGSFHYAHQRAQQERGQPPTGVIGPITPSPTWASLDGLPLPPPPAALLELFLEKEAHLGPRVLPGFC